LQEGWSLPEQEALVSLALRFRQAKLALALPADWFLLELVALR
jgi:hypothetical protein